MLVGARNHCDSGETEKARSSESPLGDCPGEGRADPSLLALLVRPDGSTAQETGDRGIPSYRSDLLPQSQRDGESGGRRMGRREKHRAHCDIIASGCVSNGSAAGVCLWGLKLLRDRAYRYHEFTDVLTSVISIIDPLSCSIFSHQY